MVGLGLGTWHSHSDITPSGVEGSNNFPGTQLASGRKEPEI